MQLSSALLSATALLAHAASGFYLRAETRLPGFPRSAIAGVNGDTVGFYDPEKDERAYIHLQGQTIVNGFGLEPQEAPGLFIFKSKRFDAYVIPDRFSVDEEGKFQWLENGAAGKWLLCGPPNALVLYLAFPNAIPQDMPCFEATLTREGA